jgi:mgtE-like transporter
MFHAGDSSFLAALKQNFAAYLFDLGGLVAGFLIAYELGVFQKAPWAIVLYPAILGAKTVIEGLLSGRLGTALHLGTIYPRFAKNTQSFYKLIEAVVVLTFITGLAMSAFSLFFGTFFWGITLADFPAIFAVVIATMTLGLVMIGVTAKVAFASFSEGLDPDIMVYPVMSMVASVFITLCYVLMLNFFFNLSYVGVVSVVAIASVTFLLTLYILPRNIRNQEFKKTIRESIVALMIVAVIVNLSGTFLKGITRFANSRIEFYTLYPALIGVVSDVGSVIGSTATTKLALGILKPKLSSMVRHASSIASAWIASILIFAIFAFAALALHGSFNLVAIYNHVAVLMVTNIIAITLIVLLSYSISILMFQKGLDPGNFVIPIENAFAASITSAALFAALVLFDAVRVL